MEVVGAGAIEMQRDDLDGALVFVYDGFESFVCVAVDCHFGVVLSSFVEHAFAFMYIHQKGGEIIVLGC